jgi:hypothetical protein
VLALKVVIESAIAANRRGFVSLLPTGPSAVREPHPGRFEGLSGQKANAAAAYPTREGNMFLSKEFREAPGNGHFIRHETMLETISFSRLKPYPRNDAPSLAQVAELMIYRLIIRLL